MRKLLLLFIVMLIIPFVIHAKSIINVIEEGRESNYKIDANYGWTFNTKNTKATASDYHVLSSANEVFAKKVFYDSDVDYSVSKVFYVDSESDCSSGKMYILYNNVGMYQGKQVNLKITVKNCKIGTNGQGGTLFKKFKYVVAPVLVLVTDAMIYFNLPSFIAFKISLLYNSLSTNPNSSAFFLFIPRTTGFITIDLLSLVR